jgi:DNA-binding transcriptional MerR regulator
MYMSIDQAAVFFGVAVVTVRRWETIGRLVPA